MNGDGNEPLQIAVGFLQRNARPQSRYSHSIEVAKLGLAAVNLHGHHDLGMVLVEKSKPFRQNPDDLVYLAIERQCASDGCRVTTKMTLPKAVGQNNSLLRIGQAVFLVKSRP